jgi:hypothetical protein
MLMTLSAALAASAAMSPSLVRGSQSQAATSVATRTVAAAGRSRTARRA